VSRTILLFITREFSNKEYCVQYVQSNTTIVVFDCTQYSLLLNQHNGDNGTKKKKKKKKKKRESEFGMLKHE